jgi:hypothetical protein
MLNSRTPSHGRVAPLAGIPGVLRLSELVKRVLTNRGGEPLGRLSDVIVRLRGHEYPLVTGLVAKVEGRRVFVPAGQIVSLECEVLQLTSARIDLRQFERREGEVLLRADILGHRLIEVQTAHLVRAADLELASRDGEWVLAGVDTRRRPRRMLGLLGTRPALVPDRRSFRDWSAVRARPATRGPVSLAGAAQSRR